VIGGNTKHMFTTTTVRCSPQCLWNTRRKHATAQRFAVPSHWRQWKPGEKPYPQCHLQSTIL